VKDCRKAVSLGEGGTPLVRARRLSDKLGVPSLWIKDESVNPTGSWEARAYACAAAYAQEHGWEEITADAGENAAVACACYAAAAGIRSRVALPPEAPDGHYVACRGYGARFGETAPGRDPLRIEGLKTAAFEIAEQLEWTLPDVVFCRTDDERAALSKGFEELIALGWVEGARPRMIMGGRVALRDALDPAIELASLEGIFAAPETGACILELRSRMAAGAMAGSDRTVVLNSASGMGYSDVFVRRIPRVRTSEADKLGGLITPR
jgi:threonine synthase